MKRAKAKAAGPAAKRPAIVKPKPEDDIKIAVKKMLPNRSDIALKPVLTFLADQCNVSCYADLEGAESWTDQAMGVAECDETLSIGAKGLLKDLFAKLAALEAEAAAAAEPADEVEAEEEEAAEEEEEDIPMMTKSASSKISPQVGSTFQRVFYEPNLELDESELQELDAKRAEMQVQVTNAIGRAYAPVTSFEELDLFPQYTLEALADMGIVSPLPIQSQALPVVLGGHDVTGIAKTGSGKTLAYLLPAVVHIEAQKPINKKGPPTPIALALAPTRELAVQISEEATKLVKHSKDKSNHPGGLWSACFFGGKSKDDQLRKAMLGTHIMAATPGRLCDCVRNFEISLSRVTFFILDEADRMLDEGFGSELKLINSQIRKERQMLFFSATWPKAVDRLATDLCKGRKEPVHLAVGQREDGQATTRSDIIQEVVVFNQETWEERDNAKRELMYAHCREVLETPEHKILVFVSNKALADELRDTLWKEGFTTDSMHGGRTQDQRLGILAAFKKNEIRMLVCTDVMGRGLDIPDITHVVIYDMGECDDYVHRIGRTARGPSGKGHALTLFEFNTKWPELAGGLIQILEESGQDVPDDLRQTAEMAKDMTPGSQRFAMRKKSNDWVEAGASSAASSWGKKKKITPAATWDEDDESGAWAADDWGEGMNPMQAMMGMMGMMMGGGGWGGGRW